MSAAATLMTPSAPTASDLERQLAAARARLAGIDAESSEDDDWFDRRADAVLEVERLETLHARVAGRERDAKTAKLRATLAEQARLARAPDPRREEHIEWFLLTATEALRRLAALEAHAAKCRQADSAALMTARSLGEHYDPARRTTWSTITEIKARLAAALNAEGSDAVKGWSAVLEAFKPNYLATPTPPKAKS